MNYVTIEPRYNLTVEKMPEQQPGRFKQPPIYILSMNKAGAEQTASASLFCGCSRYVNARDLDLQASWEQQQMAA